MNDAPTPSETTAAPLPMRMTVPTPCMKEGEAPDGSDIIWHPRTNPMTKRIHLALLKHNGNREEVAKELGLSLTNVSHEISHRKFLSRRWLKDNKRRREQLQDNLARKILNPNKRMERELEKDFARAERSKSLLATAIERCAGRLAAGGRVDKEGKVTPFRLNVKGEPVDEQMHLEYLARFTGNLQSMVDSRIKGTLLAARVAQIRRSMEKARKGQAGIRALGFFSDHPDAGTHPQNVKEVGSASEPIDIGDPPEEDAEGQP